MKSKQSHENYEKIIRDGLIKISYGHHLQLNIINHAFKKDFPDYAKLTFWQLHQLVMRDYILGVYKLLDEPKRSDDVNMELFINSINERTPYVKPASEQRERMNVAVRNEFLKNRKNHIGDILKFRNNSKLKSFRDKVLGHTTSYKGTLSILNDGIASAHGVLETIYEEYLRGWKNNWFPQEFNKIEKEVDETFKNYAFSKIST